MGDNVVGVVFSNVSVVVVDVVVINSTFGASFVEMVLEFSETK